MESQMELQAPPKQHRVRRLLATLALCAATCIGTATWSASREARANSTAGVVAPPMRAQRLPARDEAGPGERSSASVRDDRSDAGQTASDARESASARDAATSGAIKSGTKTLTGKVNLNTATAEQLILLPGIGPAKAERILEFRRRRGRFTRILDLRRVKGFGYKTVKKLAPYLAVTGDTTLATS